MAMQNWSAALFSGQQQANLGLATLNFDFSLVKLEAPKEFGPIGQRLTHFRRQAAESGTPHVTAQKLRALFQNALPATPYLIQAYGTRCSEIASAKTDKPETLKSYGIFAEHAGVDATSIWAAATSGAEAVAVHLLACMLARFWSGPEATAIWEELVKRRKAELGTVQSTEPNYLSSCMAAQITLSREQLREWDGSARAWLQTADDAMKTQHKQFMLILENIKLPVSSKTDLHESVLQAWISAMTAVDLLIQGVPQSIQAGSILLGLSSWHIYPDMLVLGTVPTSVDQNDPLVSEGGLLTIGLQMDKDQGGVFWSLPLNYLRYYGGPILAERCLGALGNHITPLQLHQVAVGCLSEAWGFKIDELAIVLTQLWDFVAPSASKFANPGTSHWLKTLSESLEPLLNGNAQERRSCQQLVQFGQRRCPTFLTLKDPSYEVPRLFGLMELTTFFTLLPDSDKRVEAMREYASTLPRLKYSTLVIRYKHYDGKNWGYEYATAIPIIRQTRKHSHDDTLSPASGHARWVTTLYASGDEYNLDSTRSLLFETLGEDTWAVEEELISCQSNTFCWREPPHLLSSSNPVSFSNVDVNTWDETEQSFQRKMDFEFLAGDPATCALFVSTTAENHKYLRGSADSRHELQINVFQKAIKSGYANPVSVLSHLQALLENKMHSSLLKSLRALATISNIYKMLPNATVSLEVTSQPLHKAPWAQEAKIEAEEGTMTQKTNYRPFSVLRMDWASTFSCIVFLESGSFNIPPSYLNNVIALSVRNSIYIAAPLLCDPSENPASYEIRRIRGNVGKPGIAMLVPPHNLRTRNLEYEDWHLVTHAPFDGQSSDSFHQTSLHLSFTGCTFPMSIESYGDRDIEIYFLESVVSVHDKGKWMADLDILSGLQSSNILRQPGICSHESSENPIIHNSDFTMVDTWNEILDRPRNVAIIRSSGNWIGRLATTALSVQMGCDTILGTGNFCWECVKATWVHHKGQIGQEIGGGSLTEPWKPDSDVTSLQRSEVSLSDKGSTDIRSMQEALESKIQKDAEEEEKAILHEMQNTFIIC
ncbi:hypothetical protein F4680DRAFT_428019 [Xylaria scruposa]|nr:hypothetical protein F4680DRAFT_428019 [Xylaria scruposa]